MDAKRELSSVDLAALVSEFGAYEGAKVDKAYLYGDDLLRLKMRDFDRGRVELIIEVGDVKRAHAADPEHVPDAPGRPPNFAMMLRNRLSGADFAGVEQFEFDRILEFRFEREDQDTIIVAELFGQGNIAVCDETYEVVDSLSTVRLKSRTVAPGSTYEFPESRINPLAIEFEPFVAKMNDSTTDVVRTLATQLNLGGLWAEEICSRAGVEKTMDVADATEDDYRLVYDALDRLREDVADATVDPRLYRTDPDADGDGAGGAGGADGKGRVVDVTPFPLEERDEYVAEAFDTFTDAVDQYFYEFDRSQDDEGSDGEPGGDDAPDFESEIAKYERIIEQQEGAIEGFEEDAEAYREQAESLYANYGLVDDVLGTVRSAREDDVPWDAIAERFEEGAEQGIAAAEAVVGVDGSEGTVTLRLDDHDVTVQVREGVEHNADRLYQEAKRVEEKKEGALAAIEDTREDLEDVEERKREYERRQEEGGEDGDGDGADDGDGEDADGEGDHDWLSDPSIPVRQQEQWYERFRWFHTTDGYLVIGGRNADQNEELVKKYLEAGDKVFHSQAHGGPVTILKATDPSEKARDVDFSEATLEQAAQFAVTYSSVWKNGVYAGDVYMVDGDQVSKTPESGEYLEKGGFAVRGDRTYFRDTPVGCAVGIQCEPSTRVVGGPPAATAERTETMIEVEPGKFAQGDAAKRIYREFRERFADTSFVRKVASPDRIQHFMPPGGSRIKED
ncbi:fibronectin-binding domain-containing protein [Halorubellus sp. JP-L1]|uniref:ribosome rescue protein RqcH n=1 Tax=Halorubellus sp. JP-L1 TaxID=2715753 RepID=UPI00140738C8|nr:ribosome rescue protein RqcH [Halorubellus sp. JP-L1]NHN41049.1 fibronectin-binding domain-containing protein [Halorubellus sp. JP-L1]